jgi:glycosyltransferase involved in cell wall biosynthesis
MIISEQFLDIAQASMDLGDEALSELTFDETVMCFLCTYKAARLLLIKDEEAAKLRADLSETVDKLLSKIAVFDLPADIKKPYEGKRVFIPSTDHWRVWANYELLKDKCLTGLHIAKITGGECVFFFGNADEKYPYLSELDGVRMPMIKNQTPDDFYNFADKEITANDILFTNGANGFDYAENLRNTRPGLITLNGMDMHRNWYLNICVGERAPLWQTLAAHYNVTATSSKSVARLINQNPSFKTPVFHIPNGFYGRIPPKPTVKENIILTVGRLGTEQKNTEALLEGFAAMSENFPDWSLRLVGSVESTFEPYIGQYFNKHPELRDRVVFTGSITDKKELTGEYSAAKIFALTSRYEGGNPNVYAEALSNGCFMLMSDSIDAAPEMIGNGKIGLKYGQDLPLDRALILGMSAMSDSVFPRLFERLHADCIEYLENELRYEIIAKKYMWLMFAKMAARV